MLKSFFWGDHPDKKNVHIIKWKELCKLMERGLGIRDTKENNLALLAKNVYGKQSSKRATRGFENDLYKELILSMKE